MKEYIAAHKFSSNHKKLVEKDTVCSCFYCLKIFSPKEIVVWIPGIPDTLGTAICPYCGVDSIISTSSGYPITASFLKKMQEYWFNDGNN